MLQRATRLDRSSTALAVTRSPRDGVVHLRVPLTWIGVRTYRDPVTGKLSRELRRAEQVWADSHIDSLKRLTCTHGHPEAPWHDASLPVMLDARATVDSGPEEDGTLRRPPSGLQVGQVGDTIERVEIDGAPIPVAAAAIHGSRALADIEAGKTQTSLGYGCLVDRTPGVWTDAAGVEWEYDAEHVLDAADPRVLKAIEDGFDATTLGANHLAVGIARGRGGTMSEILRDAWVCDEDEAPGAPVYPPSVAAINLPCSLKPLADKIDAGGDHFAVGDRVTILAAHMPGMRGETAVVAEVGTGPYYALTMPDGMLHKWLAWNELRPAASPPSNARKPHRAADAAAPVYPPSVAAINLPCSLKPLADKLAARAGSKPQLKADSISIDLPPGIDPAALADMFTMLGDQIRGMSTELAEADKAIGEGAAALATAEEAHAKMAMDAAEVAPLLAAAHKAKRDALIAEALKVAPKMPAPVADASDLEIKRAAVKARIPTFARDSADAVASAYEALLAGVRSDTAGGKDPIDAPKPGAVPPADKPKDAPAPAPENRGDSAPTTPQFAVLYGDEG